MEGVLTNGASSAIFGESNSGKTFLAIDLGCSVARGIKWMEKNAEQGIVVYLAAEAPASILARLHAYQKYHKVKMPDFVVVPSPVNLFTDEADTNAVIDLVKKLEAQSGRKVRLIIGDTLARLSAGANENSGQDMGLIVQRLDRIRQECSTHFCLIHHSGKNTANGMRGWSGIRGAIDTEIEVTSNPSGHCAEITKQRDLATRGNRIGFKLETVQLGLTKWGSPATSCIVVPAEAPAKTGTKRISEIGGAINELLASRNGVAMKKKDIVAHFQGRHDKSAVYRELKKMVLICQLHENEGKISIPNHKGADQCEPVQNTNSHQG